MGTLWAAVQRAGAGVGGSVVVAGEAGIGKRGWFPKPPTFARPLGMKVLVGRVVPGGGAMAFRRCRSILRSIPSLGSMRARDDQLPARL